MPSFFAESGCVSNPTLLKANIFIRDFHVCIADFGISTIARIESCSSVSRASTVSLVSFTSGGSLPWMSPELLDPKRFNVSDPRPTKKSDLYALGMVIYEVCTPASCPLRLLQGSDGLVGAVRTCTIRWIGSRGDQRCDIDRNSTVQAKGSGAPWTPRQVVESPSTLLG